MAWADAGALLEAAQAWWEEEYAALDEDVEEFSAAVTHRRLGDALDVVKRRSGLIVSVVVPALVLLRWPGAAVWVLRGVARSRRRPGVRRARRAGTRGFYGTS